jgi:hypothetical protein
VFGRGINMVKFQVLGGTASHAAFISHVRRSSRRYPFSGIRFLSFWIFIRHLLLSACPLGYSNPSVP